MLFRSVLQATLPLAFQQGATSGPLLQPLIAQLLDCSGAEAIELLRALALQLLIQPLLLLLNLLELLLLLHHLLAEALQTAVALLQFLQHGLCAGLLLQVALAGGVEALQLLALLTEISFGLIALLAQGFALGHQGIQLLTQLAQLGISWRLGQGSDLMAQLLHINGSLLGAKLTPFGNELAPFTLSGLGGLHIRQVPALQCR